MRVFGSSLDLPRSLTCPSKCPWAFCIRKLPRCTPIARNAIAACLLVHRSTGSDLINTNPRPFSTSSSNARSLGASVESGTSSAVSDPNPISESCTLPTALSTSAISSSHSGSTHPTDPDTSSPRHADLLRTSGGKGVSAPQIQYVNPWRISGVLKSHAGKMPKELYAITD